MERVKKLKKYEVLPQARKCLQGNRFELHPHARQRMAERHIPWNELLEVLENGKVVEGRWKPYQIPPNRAFTIRGEA